MQATTSIIISVNRLKTYQGTLYLPEYGVLEVKGEDAGTFLQGQLTCDVTTLKAGQANRGAICNHKGRMLASFYIHPSPEGFTLILPRDNIEFLLQQIGKYAIFSKVSLSDASDNYAVAGVIGDATSQGHNNLLMLADDYHRGFMLASQVDPNWQATSHLWHGLNVLAGICDVDANTRERFIPQMIDLQQFGGVSFNKGCYVGQEVVARTEHLGKLKRHLRRLQLPNNQPIESGSPVLDSSGNAIGIVTEYYQSSDSYQVLAVVEDNRSL